MKYWYVAFAFVIIWFTVHLVNNGAVSSYELTAYDKNGNPVKTVTVKGSEMAAPERLPIAKSYKPIKPIKFLD